VVRVGYARGERSLRGIERKCVEDVTYRVIAAHQKPDHATIARFRARHEDALLCKQARLVKVGCDRDRRHEGARQRLASLQP
jgi:transposase